MKTVSKKVPFSGKGFYVELPAVKVKDSEGNEIETKLNEKGQEIVTVDWMGGVGDYRLANIVGHTFKPTKLPLHLWYKISYEFLDGDSSNYNIENLVWKFPKYLESNYTGHYYVPGFSRYAYSAEYGVIDTKTGKYLTRRKTRGGYVYYSALRDLTGKVGYLSEHRAVLLTTGDYPINYERLHVNHLDGDKENNAGDNLVWCTAQENMQHAIETGLMKNGLQLKATLSDGTSEVFGSVNAAMRKYPFKRSLFANGIGPKRRFSYKGINFELVEDYPDDVACMERTPILVKDHNTGKVTKYGSKTEVMEACQIGPHRLKTRLEAGPAAVHKGGLSFKYAIDDREWDDVPDDAVLTDSQYRPVEIRNARTGDVKQYDSVLEAANVMGVSTDTIQWRIGKDDERVNMDGCQYRYAKLRKPWVEVENVDRAIAEHCYHNPILVRDVNSGEITEYAKARDAANALNIAESTVSQRLKTGPGKVYPPGLQFKALKDSREWGKEDFTYRSSKAVLVRVVDTNEVNEYPTATAAAKDNNIGTTTMNWRLKSKGQKTYSDGKQYKYKSETSPWK